MFIHFNFLLEVVEMVVLWLENTNATSFWISLFHISLCYFHAPQHQCDHFYTEAVVFRPHQSSSRRDCRKNPVLAQKSPQNKTKKTSPVDCAANHDCYRNVHHYQPLPLSRKKEVWPNFTKYG